MKKLQATIVDQAGNIVPGAEMYVRDNASLALVTLYSDNGSTETANPLVSDSDGNVEAFTDDATLKLEFYSDGEAIRDPITDYQHYDETDNEIKALRSVTSAADKLFYFTGSGTGAVTSFSAFARTFLDDADAATVLATLGAQPLDTDLTAIAALTSAADKGLQSTGAGTWALYDLTAAGKALLDDANAAAQLTTLGVSAFAQTVLDDADAATARATLGITSANVKLTESFIIACSDETTALTTGTSKVSFRMPYAFTVSAVYASLSTSQTSGSIFTVDINEAGTTILSTKLTIDNGEEDSDTAATPAVISDASLAHRAKITIDIDQVGDGTAKGLKVALVGTRT